MFYKIIDDTALQKFGSAYCRSVFQSDVDDGCAKCKLKKCGVCIDYNGELLISKQDDKLTSFAKKYNKMISIYEKIAKEQL